MKKSLKSIILTIVLFSSTPLLKAQYCIPSYVTGCNSSDVISYFGLNTISNSSGCSSGSYANYDTIPATTLYIGQPYTASVSTIFGTAGVSIWIDFNDDFIYDSSERVGTTTSYIGTNSTGNIAIHIPFGSPVGTHHLRARLIFNDLGTNADACNYYGYGEAEDYLVTLQNLSPCNSTPISGYATSSLGAACANTSFNLNLANGSIASGLLFQWQSSLDGLTWANLGSSQVTPSYTVSSISYTTYYRCITTCTLTAETATSSPTVVNYTPLINCYCLPSYSLKCTDGDKIVNFSFANLTNQLNNCDEGGFSDWTNVAASEINLDAGATYTFNISTNTSGFYGDATVGFYIDYNQNAIFEPSEFTYLGHGSGLTYSNTTTVPVTVASNSVRMRLILDVTGNMVLDPCYNYNSTHGQILDYKVNLTAAPACSGTPNAGNAISTETLVCNNAPYTLDLINNSVASNITYQWQSSTDNSTWKNFTSSQTTIPYTVNSQSVATYYRCVTTCTTGTLSASATSAVVFVDHNIITNCYCITPPTDCSGDEVINYVSFASITNTSSCNGTNGYSNYIGTVPSATLTAGQTYSLVTKVGSTYGPRIFAWIDYNQDGLFDKSEYTEIGTAYGNDTISNSITIPTSASLGTTRLRIRLYNGPLDSTDACNNPYMGKLQQLTTITDYGETEDYSVTILQQNCSTINPPNTIGVTGKNTICFAETDTLDLSVSLPVVTGITYQWKGSTGGTYTNEGIALNTSSLVVTPTVNISYFCEIMCNGNVILNSDTIFITVKPSTNISGTVTIFPNTATPVAGRVILYKYEPFYTQFDSVAGQNIGLAGDYNFTSFKSGNYIVKVIPNANNLQVAYGDTAINWKTAKHIIHGCVNNDIQNIQVKGLASSTTTPGPGVLSGIITQALGYGQKLFGRPSNESGFRPTAPGEPIGGIVVKGGRNPGAQMFSQTITEVDGPVPAIGTYTLSGLPIGEYFLLVDIPGLDTNYTYHVKITGTDTSFQNLDFTVDSIQINPVYATNVGVNEIKFDEHKIKVYPNPATNYLTIQYNLQNSSTVKMELYDILGKSVKVLLQETKQPSDNYKNTWPLDELKSGLYFLKMNIDGTENTIKISVSN